MKLYLKITALILLVAVTLPIWFFYHHGYHTSYQSSFDQSDGPMQQVLIKGRNRFHKNKHTLDNKHPKKEHLNLLKMKERRLPHQISAVTKAENVDKAVHRSIQKDLQVPRAPVDVRDSSNGKKIVPPNMGEVPTNKRKVAAIETQQNGEATTSAIIKKATRNDRAGRDASVLPSNAKFHLKSSLKKTKLLHDNVKKNSKFPTHHKLPQRLNTSLGLKAPGMQANKATPLKMFKSEQSRLKVYLQATNKRLNNVQKLFFLDKQCGDVLCTEFLPNKDIVNFTSCMHRSEHRLESLKRNTTNVKFLEKLIANPSSNVLASGTCRFMNSSGRELIGLVSFPGSGNTWVRGLLQQATGICTGAVYCDQLLRISGFDGEVVQSSSALVVKSHWSVPLWTTVMKQYEISTKGRPNFDSVIFIFRNPYDAIVSEWNRQLSTKYRLDKGKGVAHTARHGLEHFGEFRDWIRFVNIRIKQWSAHFNWILSCHGDHKILVVRYEDLREDSFHQVKRMLDFLHYPYAVSQLRTRLQDDFTAFQRSVKPEFDPYSPSERNVVAIEIEAVLSKLKDATGQTFGVEEYLTLKEPQ